MHVQACAVVMARFQEEQRKIQQTLNNANRKAMMQTQMAALQDTLVLGTRMVEEVDPAQGAVLKGFINLNLVPKIMTLQSLINGLDDTGSQLDLGQMQ